MISSKKLRSRRFSCAPLNDYRLINGVLNAAAKSDVSIEPDVFDPALFIPGSAKHVVATRGCELAQTYLSECTLNLEFVLMERQILGTTH